MRFEKVCEYQNMEMITFTEGVWKMSELKKTHVAKIVKKKYANDVFFSPLFRLSVIYCVCNLIKKHLKLNPLHYLIQYVCLGKSDFEIVFEAI